MTTHYQPGPNGEASQDEVDYLRAENKRLNKAHAAQAGAIRALQEDAHIRDREQTRFVLRDLEVRRLNLVNNALWERNYELMGKLARALKGIGIR